MRHLLTIILSAILFQSAQAQTTYATQDTVYIHAVEKAFIALKQGDCKTCLSQYQHAFTRSQKSAMSTLRAAVCAYQCQQEEQARTYLKMATVIDWWASEDIWENRKEYPELEPLRTDEFAADFLRYIDERKVAEGRNPGLERELKEIFRADNQPRLRIDTINRQYGYNSPQAKPVWEEVRLADSVNLIKVVRILDQYGYPGKHLVGEKQAITAWLVIQHAPLAIQEKYLPLLQKAAEQGELGKSNVALLVDRIRVRNGKKQLYGSQTQNDSAGKPIGFMPIEDENNVNQRRASVGLEPIENYARRFGFEYVLPKK